MAPVCEQMLTSLSSFGAWLANHLGVRGLALTPGDVVMSGSISKLMRPKAGDTIRARFARLGAVSVTIVP